MPSSRESSLGSVAMEEEEDDLYGTSPSQQVPETATQGQDLEDGEEEDDSDDSVRIAYPTQWMR